MQAVVHVYRSIPLPQLYTTSLREAFAQLASAEGAWSLYQRPRPLFIMGVGPLAPQTRRLWHTAYVNSMQVWRRTRLARPLPPLSASSRRMGRVLEPESLQGAGVRLQAQVHPMGAATIRVAVSLRDTTLEAVSEAIRGNPVVEWRGEKLKLSSLMAKAKVQVLRSLLEGWKETRVEMSWPRFLVHTTSPLTREQAAKLALGEEPAELSSQVLSKVKWMGLRRGDIIAVVKQGTVASTPSLEGRKRATRAFRRILSYTGMLAQAQLTAVKEAPASLSVEKLGELLMSLSVNMNPEATQDILQLAAWRKAYREQAEALELPREHEKASQAAAETASTHPAALYSGFPEAATRLPWRTPAWLSAKIREKTPIQPIPGISQLNLTESEQKALRYIAERHISSMLGFKTQPPPKISEISKATKIPADKFYGPTGIAQTLKKLGLVHIKEIPSRGRRGKAIALELNTTHPIVQDYLKRILAEKKLKDRS